MKPVQVLKSIDVPQEINEDPRKSEYHPPKSIYQPMKFSSQRTVGSLISLALTLLIVWNASSWGQPIPAKLFDQVTEDLMQQHATNQAPDQKQESSEETAAQRSTGNESEDPNATDDDLQIPDFILRGVAWLISAQHENGGWGAGSHALQNIRNPHQVVVDPATTAFTCLALLRAGHSPVAGDYQPNVTRALVYLLDVVEHASSDGPRITELRGTQPQTKLGPFVDTALTAQYLARVLPLLQPQDPLQQRVDRALEKCLAKLAAAQQPDGSWGREGGWAPVLQSSLACTALELGAVAGKEVEPEKLQRAREYQKGNVDPRSGRARAEAAAGVELYAFAGGGRGNAVDAREARELFRQVKQQGIVAEGEMLTAVALERSGVAADRAQRLLDAYQQNQAQVQRLNDETLLRGFGNNGGEEFLSYAMTSETLIISGGEDFRQWEQKIRKRLEKIQNQDGSWSGHHCITSPVFCTAAVVQCVLAKSDAEYLTGIAKRQIHVSEDAKQQ